MPQSIKHCTTSNWNLFIARYFSLMVRVLHCSKQMTQVDACLLLRWGKLHKSRAQIYSLQYIYLIAKIVGPLLSSPLLTMYRQLWKWHKMRIQVAPRYKYKQYCYPSMSHQWSHRGNNWFRNQQWFKQWLNTC